MKEDCHLPKETDCTSAPTINTRHGIPKLPGQDTSVFHWYDRDMQEGRRAHQIECNHTKIALMDLLIDYIKVNRNTVPVWEKLAHITKTVDWDSLKADIS